MTIRRVLTASLLVGLGLMGTLSVTQGIQSVNAQEQSQESSEMIKGRGPGGGRGGRSLARFCEGDGITGHVENMSEVVTQLDLTNTQEQYWDDVVDTAENLDVADACESGDRAEIREVAQNIREPMRTFFDSLSDEQRDELQELNPERSEQQGRNRYRQGQGQQSAQ